MKRRPKILVVGSFVMDLIVSTERFPSSGETVIGCGFSSATGGKGANQAIQAARLGAEVVMVGKVGNDDFGDRLISSAKESGVNTQFVFKTDAAPSAVGNVQLQVSESGTENRIIVFSGANMKLCETDIESLKDIISDFDMVILQNEIPMKINELVASYAKQAGVAVMLNPAPSTELSKEFISNLTYISPNEHEAKDITGITPKGEEDLEKAIAILAETGVKNVIITLGENGSVYSNGGKTVATPCVKCGKVIDPTAAGDSFVGSFCTAVAAGIPVESALQFANCAAGITVTRMGAQTSLPELDEVLSVMQSNNYDTAPFENLK